MPNFSATKPGKSRGPRLLTGDPGFGRNLKTARGNAKLTMEALAERVGVTKGLVSQFEAGQTMPSVSVLMKLADALGVSIDALLLGNGHKRASQPVLPGMGLDDRIAALPEGLREFVLLSLQRAEHAMRHVPAQFITPPTSANWSEFAAYLETLSALEVKK